jgi:hypothetical protein
MGLFSSVVKSFVPGLGEYEATKDQEKAIKEQEKANKEGAKLTFRSTVEQAEFDERTTRERTNLERSAAVEQATLEGRQAKSAIDLDVRALAARIESERSLSAVKQTAMARDAKFKASAARAMAGASGVAFEGSAKAWVDQGWALDELDRLNSAYESEVGVRGVLFDRAGMMLRGRFADEVTEFTVRQASLAADMTLRQSSESLALTRKYAEESRDFETRNARSSAKADLAYTRNQGAMNIASSILGNTTQGLITARMFGWF